MLQFKNNKLKGHNLMAERGGGYINIFFFEFLIKKFILISSKFLVSMILQNSRHFEICLRDDFLINFHTQFLLPINSPVMIADAQPWWH